MKKWLAAALLALILFVPPVHAADKPIVPTTANKVSGPVTGQLPDKIDLRVWFGGEIVTNLQSATVSFCANETYLMGHLVSTCTFPDRKLHISGKRQLTGITMTPPIEGEWRWDSDYRLTFTPAQPWAPGQNYNVKFAATVFPSNVILHSDSFTIHVAPLRASIGTIEFFQDPNESEKRGVTATIDFNTPVAADALKPHLSVKTEELTDAAKPEDRKIVSTSENLPFDLKMSDDRLRATVSVPVATMPDKERFMVLDISKGVIAVAAWRPARRA